MHPSLTATLTYRFCHRLSSNVSHWSDCEFRNWRGRIFILSSSHTPNGISLSLRFLLNCKFWNFVWAGWQNAFAAKQASGGIGRECCSHQTSVSSVPQTTMIHTIYTFLTLDINPLIGLCCRSALPIFFPTLRYCVLPKSLAYAWMYDEGPIHAHTQFVYDSWLVSPPFWVNESPVETGERVKERKGQTAGYSSVKASKVQ